MRQLGRLRQLEHDRPFAGFDHAGNKRLVAIRQPRLGAQTTPKYGNITDDGNWARSRLIGATTATGSFEPTLPYMMVGAPIEREICSLTLGQGSIASTSQGNDVA